MSAPPAEPRTPTGGPLWSPGADAVAASRMEEFRGLFADRMGTAVTPGQGLASAALGHAETFWRTVWDYTGVRGEAGNRVLGVDEDPARSHVLPRLARARFFPDARLNYAENLLRRDDEAPAVLFAAEDGRRAVLSWRELSAATAELAAALRSWGVGPGSTVAAWTPNLPETVVAMLAALSVGAVFTSTSADFGVAGVVDRFSQVSPQVLLVADGYAYNGRWFDCLARAREIQAALPSVRHVLVARSDRPLGGPATGTTAGGGITGDEGLATAGADGAAAWHDLPDVLTAFAGAAPAHERLPFDHPGFVLYSSGTTGLPKAIVHRAAGLLLKHLSEHALHNDIRPGDRVCYFTTCGWMMWNWLVSALASEATIVLYDGSPFHPGPAALWDLVDEFDLTYLGVSAKFLDACGKAGLTPRTTHRLEHLRTIASTGSPLAPHSFRWVYEDVARDVHLASISGGTDLCGCLVGGDPTRPVWEGEIQGPILGVAVDVVDAEGASLREQPGRTGDLVVTAPFPSIPLGFVGDDNSERFRAAYFERYPGLWCQGDFASWTEHGGIVIHGRSDAVLNAGGVRIGTAEIYRQVEAFPQVAEAVAIAQDWDDDTRIILFVRLADGHILDEALVNAIRGHLRTACSPRHVPARVIAVADIPRTRSGKITELAVADVVNGREVRNVGALANPEALELFRNLPELAV